MNHRCALLLLSLVLGLTCNPLIALGEPDGAHHEAKRKLVVGVELENPPYSMQEEDGSWSGITVHLWKEIATDLGVDYEFKPLDLKDMLGALQSGTVDVVAAGVGVTAARESKFDFSTPYMVASEAVAVNADQKPNLLQVFGRAFFDWGLLGLFLCGVAVMLAGGTVLWFLETRGKHDHYGGKSGKAFSRSLFWSIMVLSGRDLPESIGWSTNSPVSLAARLFGIVWMMVGVVFVALFTATAASVLTSKQLQSIVNDPQDLRHVKVGTVANSVGQEYLDHHHIKYALYGPGPEDLLKALSDHRIDAAVYNGPIMSYYAKTTFVNKVTVLRFSLRQDFMAIPLPPGSPLRKPINRALLKAIETKNWQTTVSNFLGNE